MRRDLLFCALGIFTASVGLLFLSWRRAIPKDKMNFWIQTAPYSADPLDYDAFVHHIAFRSVLVPLVTQYRSGRHVGEVAETWKPSSDYREWRFKIRSLRFANHDPITADIVARSLSRVAFKMKLRGSRSGVLEHLVGINTLSSADAEIAGIQTETDVLVLRFGQPMPQLLDQLSFGLYGVAHPDDYDSRTGEWKDAKSAISSGPYSISTWTGEALVLRRRQDYPADLQHPRPFDEIKLHWHPQHRFQGQVFSGSSLESHKDFLFFGSVSSNIHFVRCQSWSFRSGPLADTKNRRSFRNVFYEELQKLGYNPVRSFFPLAIKGIKAIDDEAAQASDNNGQEIRICSMKDSFLGDYIPTEKALINAFQRMGFATKVIEVPKQTVGAEFSSGLKSYSCDLAAITTGILVDDPDGDIRFMFLSKEGIRLPDTDGTIGHLLSPMVLDRQAINEKLFQQGTIWPVAHFGLGLWATPEVDMSYLNLSLPPTQLQWLGQRRP